MKITITVVANDPKVAKKTVEMICDFLPKERSYYQGGGLGNNLDRDNPDWFDASVIVYDNLPLSVTSPQTPLE